MTDYSHLLEVLEDWQDRIFLDGRHRYKVDGKYGPDGTTTAIKAMSAPGLVRWMVKLQAPGTARAAFHAPPLENEPEDAFISRMERLAAVEMEHVRVSKAAADVGKQVHAYVQYEIELMLGRSPVSPAAGEEALYRVAGWKRWARDAGLKPLASEARLYSVEHGYAGTLDILALLYGDLCVLDVKPTADVHLERKLQLAAYRKIIDGMGTTKTRGFINVLPRDGGEISAVEVDAKAEEYEASYAAFLHCLGLHRYQAAHERKRRRA